MPPGPRVAEPPTAEMLEPVECYLCGETAAEPFIDAQDDYTGKPGTFHFVQCRQCGLVRQNPRVKREHIGAYYDDEYISHRRKTDWGVMTWFYRRGMNRHDRDKERLVSRYVRLDSCSDVLDIGCAAATFLLRLQQRYGARVTGVDFKDLSHAPGLDRIEFHCSPFHRGLLDGRRFDLITMWHFLEHDYVPLETLQSAREMLKPHGRVVIEVPRLDSVSFRLFRNRWPGLQAPQHTMLLDRDHLLQLVHKSGLEVEEYLPYGAFPPYFYLFAGAAFKVLRGRGIDLGKAIYPYFLGQVLLSPLLLFSRRLNLAMQTVVCRRPL